MILINDERREKLGSLTDNAANICFQCGTCSAQCPVNAFSGEPLNVRRMIRSAQTGEDYDGNLWNCATCRMCETTCPRSVSIVDVILGIRTLAFEENRVPEKMEKVVWDIYENGNPWGGKRNERAKWAEGMDIKNARDGVQVLLFVGCDAAYTKRLHKSVRAVAEILRSGNVDFGILGNEENCCGEPLLNAGEHGYLDELAEKNVSSFRETGAGVIVTVSPHCSNMFRNYYRKQGLDVSVMHYSEYLYGLYKKGEIRMKEASSATITYHDPCMLSRYGNFMDGPREMLENVLGLKLVEMDHSRERSLCCGGGGNRMFLETGGSGLSDMRTDESVAAGAKTLVTACPYCNLNLQDSARTRNLELEVKELAEVLKEVIL